MTSRCYLAFGHWLKVTLFPSLGSQWNAMSDPPDPVLARPEKPGEEAERDKKTDAWHTVSESALWDMLETQATTPEGCVALIDEYFQCNGETVDDHTRELLRNLRNYLKGAK
jgi:hypothetical protein